MLPCTTDATIAFALAVQAVGSADGAAIRDQLRRIADPNGLGVITSVESLRAGLVELARGGSVNCVVAGFPLDWDEFGDLEPSGAIAVWAFTADGGYRIVEWVRAVPGWGVFTLRLDKQEICSKRLTDGEWDPLRLRHLPLRGGGGTSDA